MYYLLVLIIRFDSGCRVTKRFNIEPIRYGDAANKINVLEGPVETVDEDLKFTLKRACNLAVVDWTPSPGTLSRLRRDRARGFNVEELLTASMRQKSSMHLRNLARSMTSLHK